MDTYYKVCTYLLASLFGLCVGSFLNVVIYRLPAGIKMTNERSACPNCKSQISWYDNIPLISYILLGGKCRHCKCRISPQYPIIEASNMILWLLSFLIFADNPVYAALLSVCISCGICVFMIDAKHYVIYDRFNIIISLCGVGAMFFDRFTEWYSHLIGGVAGFIVFLLVRLFVSKKVGMEALGFGDVKFAFAMGIFLGYEKLLLAVLLASLVGCIYMLTAKSLKNYDSKHEYPFGPFLVIGFILSAMTGEAVINGYLSIFGLR